MSKKGVLCEAGEPHGRDDGLDLVDPTKTSELSYLINYKLCVSKKGVLCEAGEPHGRDDGLDLVDEVLVIGVCGDVTHQELDHALAHVDLLLHGVHERSVALACRHQKIVRKR